MRSISTVDLTEKSNVVIPPPDYLECLSMGATSDKRTGAPKTTTSTFKAPVSRPDATSTSPVSSVHGWWGVRALGSLLYKHMLPPTPQLYDFFLSFLLYLVQDKQLSLFARYYWNFHVSLLFVLIFYSFNPLPLHFVPFLLFSEKGRD